MITPFTVINAVLAWISCGVIVLALMGFADRLSLAQRLGLSLMGAGFLLTLPPLFFQNTPFDAWAFVVTRCGASLYLVSAYGPDVWRHIQAGRHPRQT